MSSAHQTARPITVHLRAEHSDARLSLTEMVVAAGAGGPPLHVHPRHAEGFYVLDGELAVKVGAETVRAPTGSFFYARPGTPHTFANFSGQDARMLVLCTPAGFEAYFDRLAAGEVDAVPPPDQSTAVGEQIRATELPET